MFKIAINIAIKIFRLNKLVFADNRTRVYIYKYIKIVHIYQLKQIKKQINLNKLLSNFNH